LGGFIHGSHGGSCAGNCTNPPEHWSLMLRASQNVPGRCFVQMDTRSLTRTLH